MFIPTTSLHSHPYRVFYRQVWTRNKSCFSYCYEFYELEVFLIFFRFQQGSGPPGIATDNVSVDRSNYRATNKEET